MYGVVLLDKFFSKITVNADFYLYVLKEQSHPFLQGMGVNSGETFCSAVLASTSYTKVNVGFHSECSHDCVLINLLHVLNVAGSGQHNFHISTHFISSYGIYIIQELKQESSSYDQHQSGWSTAKFK